MMLPKPTRAVKEPRRLARKKPIARTLPGRSIKRSSPRKVSRSQRAVDRRKKDREWSAAVSGRARGFCERCGDLYGSEAHHVISRRYGATRHVLANGVYLCRFHHTNSIYSAHQDPHGFKSWFMHKFPRRWAALQEAKGAS